MIRIGIAGLKARLSEQLKKVRNGETVIVMDRDRPVAQIVAYDDDGLSNDLIVDPPRVRYRTLGDIPKPPLIKHTGDIMEALAEERADRDLGGGA